MHTMFEDLSHNFTLLSSEKSFSSILNVLNLVLIFLTVLVNYLLWRTSTRANELQLLPLLAIYFRGEQIKNRKIRIRNIGRSPAYDIKIEPYVHIIYDVQVIWRLELIVKGTNVLVPDKEVDLLVNATSNGIKTDMSKFMVFHLDPEEDHARERIRFIITFRNAEGHYYFSKVETGQGGLYMTSPKRVRLFEKVYLLSRNNYHKALIFAYQFTWKFKTPYIAKSK